MNGSFVRTKAYPKTHWFILKRKKNKALASSLEKLLNVSPIFFPLCHLCSSPYLLACHLCLLNETADMGLLIYL